MKKKLRKIRNLESLRASGIELNEKQLKVIGAKQTVQAKLNALAADG